MPLREIHPLTEKDQRLFVPAEQIEALSGEDVTPHGIRDDSLVAIPTFDAALIAASGDPKRSQSEPTPPAP